MGRIEYIANAILTAVCKLSRISLRLKASLNGLVLTVNFSAPSQNRRRWPDSWCKNRPATTSSGAAGDLLDFGRNRLLDTVEPEPSILVSLVLWYCP